MGDPGQARRLLADTLQQAPHVIEIAGADHEARRIALPEVGAMGNSNDGVAASLQLGRELRSDARAGGAAFVREQQPGSRFSGRLRRQCRRCGQHRAAREHDRVLSAIGNRTIGDADRAAEARLVQQGLPTLLREAGHAPSDVVVEAPPVLLEPQDQCCDEPRTRRLRDRHRSPGAEQLLEMGERLAQVLGGMQDAGRDDQVERMRIEPLLDRITVDVERPALNEWILGKLVLRVRREVRRCVGEHIFGAMLRQNGKDEAGGPAGSSADLKNSQRLSLRQASHDLDDRLLQQ